MFRGNDSQCDYKWTLKHRVWHKPSQRRQNMGSQYSGALPVYRVFTTSANVVQIIGVGIPHLSSLYHDSSSFSYSAILTIFSSASLLHSNISPLFLFPLLLLFLLSFLLFLLPFLFLFQPSRESLVTPPNVVGHFNQGTPTCWKTTPESKISHVLDVLQVCLVSQ